MRTYLAMQEFQNGKPREFYGPLGSCTGSNEDTYGGGMLMNADFSCRQNHGVLLGCYCVKMARFIVLMEESRYVGQPNCLMEKIHSNVLGREYNMMAAQVADYKRILEDLHDLVARREDHGLLLGWVVDSCYSSYS